MAHQAHFLRRGRAFVVGSVFLSFSMTSKKNVAPRPALPKESTLSKIKLLPIIFVIVAGGMLLSSVLTWPILIGLQHLTDCCLIPHEHGTYISMSGTSARRLLDFPTNYMAFGALYLNFPVGFIALGWYLFLCCLFSNNLAVWRKLPKRDRALRKERQRALAKHCCKNLLIGTSVSFILCFPFIRRYEILMNHAILVKHTFDWNERVYPLNRLRQIHRSVTGKGLIFWDFNFSDGDSFTMTAPSREALTILLGLPNVSANVRVVDDQLEKTPER